MNPAGERLTAGLGGAAAACSRTRGHRTRATTRTQAFNEVAAAHLGRHAHPVPPRSLGRRVANAPPNIPYLTASLNTSAMQDVSVEPDQGRARAPHDQGRVLQYAQLQGAGRRAGSAIGTITFANDSRQQPVRHVLRVRQCRDRHLQFVLSRRPSSSKCTRDLQQHRGLHPGQLEGQQSPHDGLRRAFRPPGGPHYDEARQASNFLPEDWDRPRRRRCSTLPGCAERRVSVHRARTARRRIRSPASCSARTPSMAIGTIVPGHAAI